MDAQIDAQTAFNLINASVLPAWALLILAPNWRWTERLVQSGLWPVGLGLVYVGCLIGAVLFGPEVDVDFTTIEGVSAIFSHPLGVLTGWTHYLVFDLFAGMWEARDAKRRGMPHWLLVPCLILTFVAGPAGLLLYFALRRTWRIETYPPNSQPQSDLA